MKNKVMQMIANFDDETYLVLMTASMEFIFFVIIVVNHYIGKIT